jgi:hypothetical protein
MLTEVCSTRHTSTLNCNERTYHADLQAVDKATYIDMLVYMAMELRLLY